MFPHSNPRTTRQATLLCCLALATIFTGCGSSDGVEFVLNTEGVPSFETQLAQQSEILASQAESNADINVDERLDEFSDSYFRKTDELAAALEALFGTPDDPARPPQTGLDIDLIRRAAGPTGGADVEPLLDEDGNVIAPGYHLGGLYREHCVHCHGMTGDGAGPTALFLNPYPRDYRQGTFKFTSTQSKEKPTDEDLRRTIENGLHGTLMPAFRVALTADEISALIEYVKYFAMRGEVELFLRAELFESGETLFFEDGTFNGELINTNVELVASLWSNVTVVQPVPRPGGKSWEELTAAEKQESLEIGERLFRNEGQCIKCHGPAGLGDGGQLNYDDWNTQKALVEDEAERAEMWLLPLQELKARNLQLGVFRGGRRPIDIYRRIRNGITGTPMPAANVGGSPIPDPLNPGQMIEPMEEEQIWHIVDYVLSLQYQRGFRTPSPEMNAPNGR